MNIIRVSGYDISLYKNRVCISNFIKMGYKMAHYNDVTNRSYEKTDSVDKWIDKTKRK